MNGVTVEIGGSLREARRRLGLDLADVEAATLIRARYLEALEHERFDDLPPGSYRVVFLREYAEFLGLDGRILADEYLLRAAPAAPEARPQPPRPQLGSGAVALLDRISKVHVAVAVALLLFAVAVWRLGTGGSGSAPPVSTQAAAPRARPHRTVRHAARPQVPKPVHHAVQAAALVLVAARGTCWLLVRRGSSTGPVLYERTLAQGERVRFGLHGPLWIRFGAPWNLDASIPGRAPVKLPATTGNVLVSASGIRTA